VNLVRHRLLSLSIHSFLRCDSRLHACPRSGFSFPFIRTRKQPLTFVETQPPPSLYHRVLPLFALGGGLFGFGATGRSPFLNTPFPYPDKGNPPRALFFKWLSVFLNFLESSETFLITCRRNLHPTWSFPRFVSLRSRRPKNRRVTPSKRRICFHPIRIDLNS